MTLGEPTALGQLCLAVDAMVAEGKSEDEIIAEVKRYYSRLQEVALEAGVTMRVFIADLELAEFERGVDAGYQVVADRIREANNDT